MRRGAQRLGYESAGTDLDRVREPPGYSRLSGEPNLSAKEHSKGQRNVSCKSQKLLSYT